MKKTILIIGLLLTTLLFSGCFSNSYENYISDCINNENIQKEYLNNLTWNNYCNTFSNCSNTRDELKNYCFKRYEKLFNKEE